MVIINYTFIITDHTSVVTAIKSTMTQNNGNYSQVPGEVISAIYEMSKGANMLLVEKLVCVYRQHYYTSMLPFMYCVET